MNSFLIIFSILAGAFILLATVLVVAMSTVSSPLFVWRVMRHLQLSPRKIQFSYCLQHLSTRMADTPPSAGGISALKGYDLHNQGKFHVAEFHLNGRDGRAYPGGGLPAGVSTGREVIWRQCQKVKKQIVVSAI